MSELFLSRQDDDDGSERKAADERAAQEKGDIVEQKRSTIKERGDTTEQNVAGYRKRWVKGEKGVFFQGKAVGRVDIEDQERNEKKKGLGEKEGSEE